MMTQPMERPDTWAEYEAAKPRMIDTQGRPLVSEPCPRCQTTHFTVEPCVAEVPCPDCGSTGLRCVRPSGHAAAEWHAARIVAFDQLRDDREAGGIPQVARWPRKPIGDLLDL